MFKIIEFCWLGIVFLLLLLFLDFKIFDKKLGILILDCLLVCILVFGVRVFGVVFREEVLLFVLEMEVCWVWFILVMLRDDFLLYEG